MVRSLLSLLLLLLAGPTLAQQPAWLSSWRNLTARPDSSTLTLDSLTLLPSSLLITDSAGQPLDTSLYRLEGQRLYWDSSLIRQQPRPTLRLRFKVLPYDLERRYSHLDTSNILVDDAGNYIGFDYSPYKSQDGLIEFKGLDYNGSFSRGLSFGNSQNLVLNSNFNLQLSGDLGDDIEILAAITDQNIPLQPEGNTQQLQEFDRIFIQLKRRSSTFVAGDYELARPNSYFMNYYKKLQGATYSNELKLKNEAQLNLQASGAVARGKFARNQITPQEGNQGPYKLQGREGERFIIILAGTEKVFIDGQLLKRGLEEDYIIDYNRAEVTFTTLRLINQYTRIIVEFEYSDQSYLRSAFEVDTEYKTKKGRFYFNLYSEQDGRNSSANQELDSLDRVRLALAGDDLASAFGSGIDTLDEASEFRVKYRQVDTSFTVDGLGTFRDTVLVYTTGEDTTLFTANFVEVGFGFGDYVVDTQTGANGRVFRWVAPDANGQRQGSFIPGRQLIAPNQQQMYAVGVEYQLSKKARVHTEVAMSNNDLNRFSDRDDGDNLGLAAFVNYQHKTPLGGPAGKWNLQTDLNYELVQRNFRALNPYRKAEFTRDWNIEAQPSGAIALVTAMEQLATGGFQLRRDSLGSLAYSYSGFFRQNIYSGNKHNARLNIERGGFRLDAQGSFLISAQEELESEFFRPKIDISQTFRKLNNWTLGAYGEREKNRRLVTTADTLSPTSFHYDLYKFYLKSPQGKDFEWGMNYILRYDFTPVGNDFSRYQEANEVGIEGLWNMARQSQLKWNFTYRQLEHQRMITGAEVDQETFLGRLEHRISLFKGAVFSNTNYLIGSGQEPKIEYQYLPVNPGEGVYTWLEDRNGDGQVQLDEIEIAAFQDQADVVRVTIFTDEFIRTNNVQLNQSLRIDTRKLWYKKKDIRKFLSRFSTQSNLQILRKTQQNDEVSAWNPFQLNIADTSLVSVSSNIRNTLFFNRANPKYDLQFGMFDNRSRTVLTTGFESRRTRETFFRSRWNITQKISTQLYIAEGSRNNDSEFFNTRDFELQIFKLEPQLTFQFKQNLRTILSYKYNKSENQLPDGGETSLQNDFQIETTFNQTAATSFRLRGSFVQVKFDGETGTPLEFAMLQGLQDGQNYLWELTLDRRLARNIQLGFTYEGRKTGSARIVHVGRAQVRATF